MKVTATGRHSNATVSEQSRAGNLFVVSAPSGAGKTSLCRAVRERFPDLVYSVSYTTRARRPGEREGADYFFISQADFRQKIEAGEWAEWAEVHGNFYGTPARFLKDTLEAGGDILLDIDVQGAEQILEKFPSAVTIFILPPSWDVLRSRLTGRGTENQADVERRLADGRKDMRKADLYRHQIINDRFSDALDALAEVIDSYRSLS